MISRVLFLGNLVVLILILGLAIAQNSGNRPPEEIVWEKDGATMRLIPAGEFEMGTAESEIDQLVRDFNNPRSWFEDEVPRYTVYLDDFYIDVYEVTNALYKKFMDGTGHSAPRFWNDAKYNQTDSPVVGVTWYDAMAYAQWAGKRLPTEAEWEKAARGRLVGKRYPWGDEIDSTKANYDFNVGSTAPVGEYPPNGYGLYDMAGNVWEWCMDEYDSGFYAKSSRNNPVAGGLISFVSNTFTNVNNGRVLRGGSWYNVDYNVRVADRYVSYPSDSYNNYFIFGFRCAGSVTP